MADLPLVKIAFTDAQGNVETMWAFEVGDGLFKLDSTPWYQYGVSYQDVVAASPDIDGFLHFERVVVKSGMRTLRARSDQLVPQGLLERLVSIGCKYEGANSKMVGIDVPPGVTLSTVTDILIASGVEWEYADPTYEQVHGSGA